MYTDASSRGRRGHSSNNQQSPPANVGGKLRWDEDSDDDFDFGEDLVSSRGTTAVPPTKPAAAAKSMALAAVSTGISSRVVMKPGQRVFVRAGGSKKRVPVAETSS